MTSREFPAGVYPPLAQEDREDPEKVRRWFWAQVERVERFDGCWLWKGPQDKRGYGRVRVLGEQLAHRVAYKLTNGSAPRRAPVAQTCHVRLCCNPGHLLADERREVVPRSGGRTRIRLTEEQIETVQRRMDEVSGLRLTRKTIMAVGFVRELAREFGVSVKTIVNCALGAGIYREDHGRGV
jgi:hypothetical protein